MCVAGRLRDGRLGRVALGGEGMRRGIVTILAGAGGVRGDGRGATDRDGLVIVLAC